MEVDGGEVAWSGGVEEEKGEGREDKGEKKY